MIQCVSCTYKIHYPYKGLLNHGEKLDVPNFFPSGCYHWCAYDTLIQPWHVPDHMVWFSRLLALCAASDHMIRHTRLRVPDQETHQGRQAQDVGPQGRQAQKVGPMGHLIRHNASNTKSASSLWINDKISLKLVNQISSFFVHRFECSRTFNIYRLLFRLLYTDYLIKYEN